MSAITEKQAVALAALQYLPENSVLGVGTGSTTNYFIDALASHRDRFQGAVASSEETAQRLKAIGIPLLDANSHDIAVYVDGADEVNSQKQLIKGGGGALTREKIIAACAKIFVCIVDSSKQSKALGHFPLAIEVHPMARSLVARQLVKLGGSPMYREGFVTDNGNIILDTHHLNFSEPIALEEAINNITGVICHGLFAKRTADIVLVACASGVTTLK